MSVNHRAEAERLLAEARVEGTEGVMWVRPENIAAAQVYATLADGETRASDLAAYRHTISTMRFALVRQIAEGLALSEGDEAHSRAVGLARYLDSVDLNVDREVDTYIEEHCGMSPRDAWKSPTVRREEWAKDHPCPF